MTCLWVLDSFMLQITLNFCLDYVLQFLLPPMILPNKEKYRKWKVKSYFLVAVIYLYYWLFPFCCGSYAPYPHYYCRCLEYFVCEMLIEFLWCQKNFVGYHMQKLLRCVYLNLDFQLDFKIVESDLVLGQFLSDSFSIDFDLIPL